jgi:hypothetical protein
MAEKKYVGCDKVMEAYPDWKLCERPVKAPEYRCELHPIKKLWPEG